MDWKKIFEILEAAEGGADLVSAIKEHNKTTNNAEAKLRTIEKELGETPIADLKTAHEFLNKAGGLDGISKKLKDADGLDGLKAELASTKTAAEKTAAEFTAQLKAERLKSSVIEQFTSSFNGAKDIMELALSRGLVSYDDKDNIIVSGPDGSKLSLDKGFDHIKKQFDYALKTPSGGGIDPTSGGNGGPVGKTITREQYDSMTQADKVGLSAKIAKREITITD